MHITVLLKPVPDPGAGRTFDPVSKTLVRQDRPVVINPLDRSALDAAVALRERHGGRVTVLSLAPRETAGVLKEALALGADEAYLVSDRCFAGSDTLVTSFILSRAVVATGPPDLVLAGNRSSDSGTSHVPAQLGEWLVWPHLSHARVLRTGDGDPSALIVTTELEDRFIHYRLDLPAVVAVTGRREAPRHPTMRDLVHARAKPVTLLDAAALGLTPAETGLAASPTRPGRLIPVDRPAKRGEVESGPPVQMAALILSRLHKLLLKG